MEISVVIPTRNRAEYVDNLLALISNQTLDREKYEVLIIDNGSTDHTSDICQKWHNEGTLNLKYIFDATQGLHVGRNRGYIESKADIIVYADDDIIPSPIWLEAILKGFMQEEVVLIGGNNIPRFETTPPDWIDKLWVEENDVRMLLEFSCIILGDEEKRINPMYVFGCNFAVRRSILDSTYGFHPDGMPDSLLQYRGDGESYVSKFIHENDKIALFIPEASVYHMVERNRMTEKYIYKIAYRAGISDAYTLLHSQSKRDKWVLLKRIVFGLFIMLVKRNNSIKYKEKFMMTRGMFYLFKNFIFDKKVREWIKRRDYLGENGIIPNE